MLNYRLIIIIVLSFQVSWHRSVNFRIIHFEWACTFLLIWFRYRIILSLVTLFQHRIGERLQWIIDVHVMLFLDFLLRFPQFLGYCRVRLVNQTLLTLIVRLNFLFVINFWLLRTLQKKLLLLFKVEVLLKLWMVLDIIHFWSITVYLHLFAHYACEQSKGYDSNCNL